jgi:predicted nucleic-acid-binding protein
VYVLFGVYKVNRKEILERISDFIENTHCMLPHKKTVLEGLKQFSETNFDFVDCLLIGYALMEGAEIFTFDQKLRNKIHR